MSDRGPKAEFLVGLSVGQGSQPSGVAVLERHPPSHPGSSRSYTCRYLRRWVPPATAYPALVRDLTNMLCDTELTGNDLIVEAGPGIRAVVGYLRKQRLQTRIQPVELKASAEDGFVEGLWRVTKASMIETTRLALQEGRLVFDDMMPPELLTTTPSAQTVYHALLTSPYNKTPAANDAFASREDADDDLILAVALACWYGECCRRTFWMR
ncbi:MAG TPA: hypothetical protein VG099_17185 [Gemmataceae bacterium]|nr:hypothetical protein [Gemmataceae bacterium]